MADRRAELEQALFDHPDANDTWMVYADWLQGQGDPRGALIVAAANDDAARVQALLAEHGPSLLGRFGPGGDLEPFAAIVWGHGFWRSAKVAHDYKGRLPSDVGGLSGVLAQLLQHPSARFLRDLSLGLMDGADGQPGWQRAIDHIVETGPHPGLRELFVGDYRRMYEMEISWTTIGRLDGLWAVLPHLTDLKVQGGGIGLGPIDAPKLESLTLWTGGLPKEPVHQIGRASLPALSRLELWFGNEEYGAQCSIEDVVPLLEGRGLPAITWLGLMNADFANDLPERIIGSPLLPRLKVLDLSMGTMTDDGARVLVANADKLQHLDLLNLDKNFISDELEEQLDAALGCVEVGEQKDADDWVYVSVGE